jgi:hypothetical protein
MKSENLNEKAKGLNKEFTLIVNGREKVWLKREITFTEVVELAFDNMSDNPNITYTVTYTRGHGNKPEGTLVKGEEIKVKEKMIFNATATDKS